MGRKSKGFLLPVHLVSDFRPGLDRVIRNADGRCFIRDSQGLYADFPVMSDVLTDEYRANGRKLTDAQFLKMHDALVHHYQSGLMSLEGYEERESEYRSEWQRRFPGELFVAA